MKYLEYQKRFPSILDHVSPLIILHKSKYKSASLLEQPENVEVLFHNNTVIEIAFDSVVRANEYEVAHIRHKECLKQLRCCFTVIDC